MLHDLLAKVDALLPDLAPVEHDGRTYRPADDQEVASTLALDERGRRRKTGWEGMFTKIAAASRTHMPCRSNLVVSRGPPSPLHTAGDHRVPGINRASGRRGADE